MDKESATATKERRPVAVILVVVVAALAGGLYWHHASRFESTDNAQLDGDIIPVRSKLAGYLAEVRFQDNQRVKKGDTLAVFETVDLRAQLAQAQARGENALASTEATRNGRASADFAAGAATFSTAAARENVEAAQARETQTKNDLARLRNLHAQGAATAQSLDAAQAAYDMAAAQLRSAKEQAGAIFAQRQGAGSQATAQSLQVRAALARQAEYRAQVEAARDLLSKAYVLAPADGIVSRKSAEPGQMVASGAALAMLVVDRNLWITANFKETQLDKLQKGQEVEAPGDAYPAVRIFGSLENLAGATGAKFALLPADNASGNFIKVTQRVPVRIRLSRIDNPRGKELVPGLNVVVTAKVR
jgi:membrane fusion protein, multidrug efflux system